MPDSRSTVGHKTRCAPCQRRCVLCDIWRRRGIEQPGVPSDSTQCRRACNGAALSEYAQTPVSLCWSRQHNGCRWAIGHLGRSRLGLVVTVHSGVVGYGNAEPVGVGRHPRNQSASYGCDWCCGVSHPHSCHRAACFAQADIRPRSTGGYPPPIGKLEALARGPHPADGLLVCPKSHHANYIQSAR
jgi:hypothetical protein